MKLTDEERALKIAQDLSRHGWQMLNSEGLLRSLWVSLDVSLRQSLMELGVLENSTGLYKRTPLGDQVLVWMDVFHDSARLRPKRDS